jgi:hypothetical protein
VIVDEDKKVSLSGGAGLTFEIKNGRLKSFSYSHTGHDAHLRLFNEDGTVFGDYPLTASGKTEFGSSGPKVLENVSSYHGKSTRAQVVPCTVYSGPKV